MEREQMRRAVRFWIKASAEVPLGGFNSRCRDGNHTSGCKPEGWGALGERRGKGEGEGERKVGGNG